MDYSVDRLRWITGHWPEVCAAAEDPGAARGLVSRTADRAGPTPTDPRGGRRSVRPPVDHHRWTDVHADVSRAYLQLAGEGLWSLERRMVELRMAGYTTREIEDGLRIRHGEGSAALRRALHKMSELLEPEGDAPA